MIRPAPSRPTRDELDWLEKRGRPSGAPLDVAYGLLAALAALCVSHHW